MARVYAEVLGSEWRGGGILDVSYKVCAEYGSGATAGEYNGGGIVQITLPANPNPTTQNNAVKTAAVAEVNAWAGSNVVSNSNVSLTCGFS